VEVLSVVVSSIFVDWDEVLNICIMIDRYYCPIFFLYILYFKTIKTTVKLKMLPWGWVIKTVMVFLGAEAINPLPVASVNSTRNCFASLEIVLLFSNILI
jgi:hypothetical protein